MSTSTPVRAERRADPGELARVQPAQLGLAARRREARSLVGETERQGDRRRVGVGIHQTDVPAAAGQFDRELDRDRRAAGRAGRSPDGDHPRPCGRCGRRFGRRSRSAPEVHRVARRAARLPRPSGSGGSRPNIAARRSSPGPAASGTMRTARRSQAATTAAFSVARDRLEHHRVRVGERAADVDRSADPPSSSDPGSSPSTAAARADAATTASTSTPSLLEPVGEIAAVRLVDRDDDPHCAAPDVGHDREGRLVGHRGERRRDIRPRNDELEGRRAAADHRVVPRHRDDGRVGDQDARHVVVAALEERSGPDLDDGAGARPNRGRRRRCAARRSWCGPAAASPTALGGHQLAGLDRAGRDQPVGERVGRAGTHRPPVRARRRPARRRRPRSPHPARSCGSRRTPAPSGATADDDEPDTGDGRDDQQDAEEEPCDLPRRRGAGARTVSSAVMTPSSLRPPNCRRGYPQRVRRSGHPIEAPP